MDLSTQYLGLDLPHPLMPGASPLVDDLDTVKRLEDAGAAAIVMHSLFEEQLIGAQERFERDVEMTAESFAEATSYFPSAEDYRLGPEQYLEQIRSIKQAVSIPVIGSLNGVSLGGWVEHAKMIEEAGADALELNTYFLATDPAEAGQEVETRTIDILSEIKKHVTFPVAVKLSPFFSSLPHFAAKLEDAGADGLVLFNRFYQADIDVEKLEALSQLELSQSSELLLRLRWLAILSGRMQLSLAASGGVHTVVDAIKALMAGANAIQVVSALLKLGPQYIGKLRDGIATWLERHEYESLNQAVGSMNLEKSPDPSAYERANYVRLLQGWPA